MNSKEHSLLSDSRFSTVILYKIFCRAMEKMLKSSSINFRPLIPFNIYVCSVFSSYQSFEEMFIFGFDLAHRD